MQMQVGSKVHAGVARLGSVLGLAMLFLLGDAREAHAYLDAGSASLIFQAVIGFVVSAAFVIKVYWRRILSKLGFGSTPQQETRTGSANS